VVALVRKISEQRHRLIVERADPFLDEGEDVIQWVRARRASGKGAGFIYLTVKRVIFVWPGSEDDVAFLWDDISSWGLRLEHRGGPLLGLETDDGTFVAQVVAATGRMAEDVAAFVRRFAQLASPSGASLDHPEHGHFEQRASVEVSAQKRSIGGLTKRFMITLLGAVLFSVGVLIIPLPGPWSLPLMLAGLAVLGSEYDWAKDALDWAKKKYEQAKKKLKSRTSG
jgi:uncharacterized protein (TIGR02611 family)